MARIILFFILLLSGIFMVSATNSVIIDSLASSPTFKISCLGKDNLLTIYSYDVEKPEGVVSYQGDCDIQETLPKQYLENAQRIQIRNGEDSETLINYIEVLNQIEDENANAKIEEFTDKVCVTVETSRFSDIKVVEDLEQQVKSYYKCFQRSELSQLPNTELENEILIEVLINDKLFREFKIKLPIKELKISLTDLGLISEANKQYMNVKFTNPTGESLKVSVLGTNLGCPQKSFTMGDRYSMLCNKTEEEVPIYFMQVKDGLNRITYKEYQLPPSNDSGGDNTVIYIIAALALVGYFAYNKYKGQVEEKNESSFDKLDKEN